MQNNENNPIKVDAPAILKKVRAHSAKLFSAYLGPRCTNTAESGHEVNEILKELQPLIQTLQQLVLQHFDTAAEVPIDLRMAIDAALRLGISFDDYMDAQKAVKNPDILTLATEYPSLQNAVGSCRRRLAHTLAAIINATQFEQVLKA